MGKEHAELGQPLPLVRPTPVPFIEGQVNPGFNCQISDEARREIDAIEGCGRFYPSPFVQRPNPLLRGRR
jgi:hypothetical protein